ncbi:MAG: hypothetical protein OEZ57_02595 [Nitrospirota bacterium]|nr:hypothetical protein [Nitrospirota bacterium]MDH5585669.1 hypothetical protein [Nitrospirota bacterium]MDH5773791.1 hypothetical protein [Nitrospirota bacterium]
MNRDQAGRLQEVWKTKHGDKLCQHTRVIDSLFERNGQTTGNVGCHECGAIFPDPRLNPKQERQSRTSEH